jgi:branched-chain amino acid transport system permease protein
LDSEKAYLYLIIIGILLTIVITNFLQNSRVGRAWMAMREDETVAQAMGINTLYYKLMAFATGAAFAGIGGALFAARNQYTGPADHTLMVSINVLSLLIVGGMGSIPGVIVGAFVLKGLPEILRELDLYRMLVFGGLLVTMMIIRPEGIWPAPRRMMELKSDEGDGLPPEESLFGEEG